MSINDFLIAAYVGLIAGLSGAIYKHYLKMRKVLNILLVVLTTIIFALWFYFQTIESTYRDAKIAADIYIPYSIKEFNLDSIHKKTNNIDTIINLMDEYRSNSKKEQETRKAKNEIITQVKKDIQVLIENNRNIEYKILLCCFILFITFIAFYIISFIAGYLKAE